MTYKDPYTGSLIPDGVPIVKCPPNGHVNRADSWAMGNRCHHPACSYSGEPIPIPSEAERLQQALDRFRAALQSHNGQDDERVLAAWQEHATLLNNHPESPGFRNRVELAQERINALKRIQTECSKQGGDETEKDWNIYQTWRTYSDLLEDYTVATTYKAQARAAEKRLMALQELADAVDHSSPLDVEAQDAKILSIWQKHEPLLRNYPGANQHHTRIATAQKRQHAITELNQIIGEGAAEAIVKCWQKHKYLLEGSDWYKKHSTTLALADKRVAGLRDLNTAFESDSDRQINAVWKRHEDVLQKYKDARIDYLRLALAQKRKPILEELLRLLQSKEPQKLARFFLNNADILKTSVDFLQHERQEVEKLLNQLASQKVTALRQLIFLNNDLDIARTASQDGRLLTYCQVLTPEEQNRIALANQRSLALAKLRAALDINDHQAVMNEFIRNAELLKSSYNFSATERLRVNTIRQSMLLEAFRAAVREKDIEQIVLTGQEAIRAGSFLDSNDHLALTRAALDREALYQIKLALDKEDDQSIAKAYRRSQELSVGLTEQEKGRCQQAQERVARWRLLKVALQRDDDAEIARLYDDQLFAKSNLLTLDEQKRCQHALRRVIAATQLQELVFQDSLDTEHVIRIYDTASLDSSPLVTSALKSRISRTKEQQHRHDQLRKAISSTDIWQKELAFRFAMKDGISLTGLVPDEEFVRVKQVAEGIKKLRTILGQPNPSDESIVFVGKPLLEIADRELNTEEKLVITQAIQRYGSTLRRATRA